MSNNETVVMIVLVLAVAVVVVVALRNFKNIILIIEKFKVTFICEEKEPSPSPDRSVIEFPKMPQGTSPWLFRHWRAILIWPAFLLLFGAPVWWWAEQPKAWRTDFSDQLSHILVMLFHGSGEPQPATATLEKLTRTLESRTSELNNLYHDDEIWIVNHYWQYWSTANLQEYLNFNKVFVAKGGKIHRMFLLSNDELQNPDVQAMLQAQCEIGENQTGNGFELWRANPKTVKDREEYKTIASQFGALSKTDESFDNFDIVRFNSDILYYSSNFSPDYRVLGKSFWLYDPVQVKKVDLRPLFNRHVAERIACDGRTGQEGPQQASVAAPPHFARPI